MNIADEMNAVIRRIKTSGESHQVVLERAFDTDAEDLWDACTNPERLARWFEPVRGDLALGGRYGLTLSGTEGDIRRCEPPRHLTITWEHQGTLSLVDVDLISAANELTLLRVAHHCPPDDHWAAYGPAATGVGWEDALRALSLYLTVEDRSAPDELEGFAGTAEGRELTRRVKEAWGVADREAGTPASDAQSRAQRTAAFYLDSSGEDKSNG